jgi:transposase
MKTTRRKYEKSFKIMAVELVNSGKSKKEVSADLGIRQELLGRWCREFNSNSTGSFSGNGRPNLTPEQKQIVELKKALRDAELERDILKKAVSIFSKNR